MESKLFQWLKGNRNKLLPKKNILEKDVSEAYHVRLVEGLFDPAESAEVLLSLLNYKIKFHTVQLLNLKETKNSNPEQSQKRIEALKTAKQEVTELVVKARNKGQKLEIHSTVKIVLR
ncbi:hypothetical protein FVB32_07075 [Flagellimonas hymeniacidonis]|uniref:Uncharacterized protein n=1 Tax=Flagellimonas hymeniacidonis TaxID=2603628 RepID=A0A5C8VB70_9FLAO|nr:hypothetical protein [Flagellimonas hymeniacidonis]TXN38048.1 hypothetical protein FVB32_07075 [Flagellimonas hymeniacidonis]